MSASTISMVSRCQVSRFQSPPSLSLLTTEKSLENFETTPKRLDEWCWDDSQTAHLNGGKRKGSAADDWQVEILCNNTVCIERHSAVSVDLIHGHSYRRQLADKMLPVCGIANVLSVGCRLSVLFMLKWMRKYRRSPESAVMFPSGEAAQFHWYHNKGKTQGSEVNAKSAVTGKWETQKLYSFICLLNLSKLAIRSIEDDKCCKWWSLWSKGPPWL